MASECLALARQTSDPLVRFSRLELAQKWIELAELSEHDPSNDALRRRAIQAAIGQKLRHLYEASPDLPHHMLTILMQLNADQPASMEESEIGPTLGESRGRGVILDPQTAITPNAGNPR